MHDTIVISTWREWNEEGMELKIRKKIYGERKNVCRNSERCGGKKFL